MLLAYDLLITDLEADPGWNHFTFFFSPHFTFTQAITEDVGVSNWPFSRWVKSLVKIFPFTEEALNVENSPWGYLTVAAFPHCSKRRWIFVQVSSWQLNTIPWVKETKVWSSTIPHKMITSPAAPHAAPSFSSKLPLKSSDHSSIPGFLLCPTYRKLIFTVFLCWSVFLDVEEVLCLGNLISGAFHKKYWFLIYSVPSLFDYSVIPSEHLMCSS